MNERVVVIVGPFFGDCNFAPSPAARLDGYARHLPEFGWRPLVIAPACCCTIQRAGLPAPGDVVRQNGSVVFRANDERSYGCVRHAVQGFTSERLALRPVLAAPRALRWWAALVARSGLTPEAASSAMSSHWFPGLRQRDVQPLEGGPRRVAAGGRVALAPLVRAQGPVIRHVRESALRRLLHHLAEPRTAIAAVLGSHGYAPEIHAASDLARALEVPFVAELRDAVWRRWRPAYETIELLRVARSVRSADAVVHVTPQEQERDRWWLGQRGRRLVIEHGFDAEEWDRILQTRRERPAAFTIRCIGTLTPQLQLDVFLEGYVKFLKRLSTEQRKYVRFEYVGKSAALAHDLVHRTVPAWARSSLIVQGAVTRSRALLAMADARLLVLPMARGIPGGRFYEYLGSRTPILAFGDGVDPYVDDALRRSGAGTVAVGAEAVAAELRRLIDGVPAVGSGDVEHFTRRRQAKQLAGLLDELVGR